MATQPTQANPWRAQLGAWLQAVAAEAQLFPNDLGNVVQRHRQGFPPSTWYSFWARLLWRDAAKWLLKTAIQEAAQQAGVQLTPEAADLIAGIAVDFL
jgi:hypothetical protein